MARKTVPAKRKAGQKPRHRFVFNQFSDIRCTRCPRCEVLTKLRKMPLLVQVEPQQLVPLQKAVRYCPACDLLVVHQDELERELAGVAHEGRPELLGQPYYVRGTLDAADWKQITKEPLSPEELLARYFPFREVLELQVSRSGWFPAGVEPPLRTPPRGLPRVPSAPRREGPPTTVYQLKITLAGIQPEIWRRVLVRADLRLSELHRIIQVAMGWTDSHLHAFTCGETRYELPSEGYGPGLDFEDERQAELGAVLTEVGAGLQYEYDFGDGWDHTVHLEAILPADPEATYPVCVAGERACPPEDCGGAWGYVELLEILRDPGHPEHQERLEWLGRRFDPEGFDRYLVNYALAALRA
jgi:hypothetical protein